MKKHFFSLLTAGIMCASVFGTAAPAYAAPVDGEILLPDWIPQNFSEAMEFYNQHGKTYIADGLICCVREQYNYYRYKSDDTEVLSPDQILLSETYVLPEKPDISDTEAYVKYLQELEALGIDESLAGIEARFNYNVSVYVPQPDSELTVNWEIYEESRDKLVDTIGLSFDCTADNTITETDIYGWLPDCITEYKEFHEKYKGISVHNGYIVFCDDVIWDGGYGLYPKQTGTAEVELAAEENIFESMLIPIPGNSPGVVMAYKPVSEGTVRMEFRQKQGWMEDSPEDELDVQCYEIDENMNIKEITEEEMTLEGDVNADGVFSVRDMELLRDWLVNIPDTDLPDWKAGNMHKDDKLDVFDMCKMKRKLIEKNKNGGQIDSLNYYIADHSVIRRNTDAHEKAQMFVADTLDEMTHIIAEAEAESGLSVMPVPTVPEVMSYVDFDKYSVLVMYTRSGAGNNYSIVDSMVKDKDKLNVHITEKNANVPSPDMMYRRFIFLVSKEDLGDVNTASFSYTNSIYSYNDDTERVEVSRWFDSWLYSKLLFVPVPDVD